jgi:hypothetical protein
LRTGYDNSEREIERDRKRERERERENERERERVGERDIQFIKRRVVIANRVYMTLQTAVALHGQDCD